MTNDDRKEFVRTLASVYAMNRVDLSDDVAELWRQILSGYELTPLKDAFANHLKNPDAGQYPPKPADIVRELGGTTQDKSLLAWASVMQAVRRYGTHDSVQFEDQIIHRVMVDLGGWVWLGQQQEKELPFIEKRFRDAYRAWLHRGSIGEPIPHLAGFIEQTNRGAGFHDRVPPPKRIGATARQLEVR